MATITCDSLISQNIAKDCANPMVQGVERKGWIINRKDVDFANVEFVEGSTNQVSALPLLTGKKAYTIEQYGTTPFTGSSTVLTPGTYGGSVTNNISFVVPNNSPAVAENILDAFLDGEFIVILENKQKGLQSDNGASAFQIFGYWQGLTLAESTRELYSDETRGGYPISLTETNAPKSAMFLNAGTYEATRTLLNTMTSGN